MRTFSSTSPTDRQPVSTDTTAGWRSGNWIAEAVESAVGAIQCFLEVIVRVVDVEHVDAIQPETFQAFLDRAHHSVVAEVVDGIDGWYALVSLAGLGGSPGAKQPADLRREDELVAGLRPEHRAKPLLSQTVAVQRSGVEEADPSLPRGLDNPMRLVVGDLFEEPAKRRAAKAESRHLQRRLPEWDAFLRFQARSKMIGSRSLLWPLKSCAFAIIGAISACQRTFTGSVARSAIARS